MASRKLLRYKPDKRNTNFRARFGAGAAGHLTKSVPTRARTYWSSATFNIRRGVWAIPGCGCSIIL